MALRRETLTEVYLNRRMAALVLLGFSSGLPLLLTQDTMVAWLKDAKVSIEGIGVFALVGLPYSLKFLWAPAMDRFSPRLGRLGRRRSWLVIAQVLLIIAIAAMGLIDPGQKVFLFGAMAMTVAFCSASQDIVSDAYRTDILPHQELGVGAAFHVNGYRIAMIVAGGAALILADYIGWKSVYLFMAVGLSVGLLGTLLAPEPPSQAQPESFAAAVVEPFRDFFIRNGNAAWFVLIFVFCFKLPDPMASWQTNTFLKTLQFSNSDIGIARQWFGLVVTIVGALIGGGIVARLGLIRSLWIIGALQAASNAGFLLLALSTKSYPLMISVIGFEAFCAGLVTAGFVAYLMSQCSTRYSATQYALLTSLMALAGVLIKTPTGYLAQAVGWPWFFTITILAGLPGMIMLLFLREPVTSQALDVLLSSDT
ncbi:MAG: MFS transporter [Phycisphaeraceae bacterium]|nr:MFS transporter [Phycisphaeraceae bacterium]